MQHDKICDRKKRKICEKLRWVLRLDLCFAITVFAINLFKVNNKTTHMNYDTYGQVY